ncbi:hypothetical protein CONCODRAFT_105793 [Conidiobolus coronatus NRRL 28638]|uniref:COPI associated n=1 Tax=Conidiobolus coronatus (strain ATCC 28846 / CBS 209.66 / NRRL 28638) TaxID=796925 RepID=A0A137NZQ8_CONC2|nr:hypothetical protein CONCODRAFT_105793 [Conidiobolus coronatus NRRL 28638]|eukprot:KXN68320.1 hypothetical protein CONCODRAFT_105793 [Conidiobolus coronatus NRRL 28638]
MTKLLFQNVYLYKLLLNLVNISVYLIVGVTSIINLVRYINYEAENKDDINVIGINSFACALCLLLITSEFYLSNLVFMYLKFLCTFIGRGLLFLLFGFMIYRLNSFNAGVTYYVTVIGLSFIILSFFPSISLMEDVRSNWSNFREYARDGSRSHYYASSPDNAQNHHDTSPIRINKSKDGAKL